MENKIEKFTRLLRAAETDPARLSLGERLFVLRGVRLRSLQDIAKATGMSWQTVQDLESGRSKGSKNIVQIARYLESEPEWIIDGSGENPLATPGALNDVPDMLRNAPTTDLNIQAMPRDFPVRGGALCGEDGLFEMNGQTLDYVRRPPRLMGVKDAYAVYSMGECMVPWREHGSLVYVHPHQPVKIGDYVVVQMLQEGEGGPIPAYLKRLVRRTATNLVLHQYNPAKDITLPTKKVGAIHRVMDWDELMGF